MKSEEELRAEVEKIKQVLKDKADKGDKSDWDYYTFRKDALQWALGEYER